MEPAKPHQLQYATPPPVARVPPAQMASRGLAAAALGIGFMLLLEGISILGEAADLQAAVMILCGVVCMVAAMWYGRTAFRQPQARYGVTAEHEPLRKVQSR